MATARQVRSSLDLYLASIRGTQLLCPDREKDLARRGQTGDEDALRELVSSNLSFVVRIAKELRHHAIPFEDLLNAGNVGLVEASRRYDPDRGSRFVTYASWWIRKCMLEAIASYSNMMRIPRYHRQRAKRIREEERALRTELGREPRTDEVSERVAFSLTADDHLRLTKSRWFSLDEPVAAGAEMTFEDRLPDESVLTPEETVLLDEDQYRLLDAIRGLGERERTIIRYRFGLEGRPTLTFQEIGEMLSLSRERVRQLEAGALRRLRRMISNAR